MLQINHCQCYKPVTSKGGKVMNNNGQTECRKLSKYDIPNKHCSRYNVVFNDSVTNNSGKRKQARKHELA